MFAPMKLLMFSKSLFALGLGLGLAKGTVTAVKGAKVVKAFGYENCIELINKTTRVVLAPAGGRVLSYEVNGVNALYLSESDSRGKGGSSAGRFDIGPERVLPRHDLLWSGPYTGEVTGNRGALGGGPLIQGGHACPASSGPVVELGFQHVTTGQVLR